MTKMKFLVQVVQIPTDKQTYTLKHYQSALLITETQNSILRWPISPIAVADPGFSKWGALFCRKWGGAHPVFR